MASSIASASSCASRSPTPGDGAVHPGAAHLLERDLLADDHLGHARAAEVHRRVALDHDDEVAEARDVGPARRRLGPNRQQICGTLPDSATWLWKMRPAPRRPGNISTWSVIRAPARVDEPEDRQLLAQRHLGGPHDLLDGARAPRAGLDGRVVGDDDRRPAVDGAAPGDHAVGRQPGGQRVGVAAVLDERCPRRTAGRSGRARRACPGASSFALAFSGGAGRGAVCRGEPLAETGHRRVGAGVGADRERGLLRATRRRHGHTSRTPAAHALGRPRSRAMTMRCTSEVPSPISRILASR